MTTYDKDYYERNKEAMKASRKKWYEKNKERILAKNKENYVSKKGTTPRKKLSEEEKAIRKKEYLEKTKEQRYQRQKEWREANPDYNKEWRKNNKERVRYLKRGSKAVDKKIRKQRKVDWSDNKAINAIYDECYKLNKEAGYIKYHVDHEVPLRGKLVSGLHVHTNLRIILAEDNVAKSNDFEVK